MKTVILDGARVESREQLHAFLAEALQFPEWYGGNLDALNDCLTDLAEETEICLVHREALEEALGPYAKGLMRALAWAEEENPRVKVIVKE